MANPTFEAYIKNIISDNKNVMRINNFNAQTLYRNYIDWLVTGGNETATVNELLFQIAVISAYVESMSQIKTNNLINADIVMTALDHNLIAGIEAKKNDLNNIIQTHFKKTDADVHKAVLAASNQYFNEYTRNRIGATIVAGTALIAGCFAPTATGFTMLFLGIMSGICFATALYMLNVRMIADTTKPEIEIKFFNNKDYLKNQNRYLKAKVHAIHKAINPINPNSHQYDGNSEIMKTVDAVADAIKTKNTYTNACLIKTITAATQNRYALMYKNSKAPCTQIDNGTDPQNVDLKSLAATFKL